MSRRNLQRPSRGVARLRCCSGARPSPRGGPAARSLVRCADAGDRPERLELWVRVADRRGDAFSADLGRGGRGRWGAAGGPGCRRVVAGRALVGDPMTCLTSSLRIRWNPRRLSLLVVSCLMLPDLVGCSDEWTPLEGGYWFDDVAYVQDCAAGDDTGGWPLTKYSIQNGGDLQIDDVREAAFQFTTYTPPSSQAYALTLDCLLTNTDANTFECSPYADSQGNSWTSSGVWLSDTVLRGRFQYVGATDGEDAEPCNGYWLFSASWVGPLP